MCDTARKLNSATIDAEGASKPEGVRWSWGMIAVKGRSPDLGRLS
jgi:hypothetical protein